MKRFDTTINSRKEIAEALTRAHLSSDPKLEETVRSIIDDVKKRGDTALLEYGQKWDCPYLEELKVSELEITDAFDQLHPSVHGAIAHAAHRIREFHKAQLRQSWWMTSPDGGLVGQMISPIQSAGAYVPGGKAIYPSSVLMNCIPAQVAGVEETIMCVPAGKDGRVHPSILVASVEAGVKAVFKVGGAQAIAAMAYGTKLIPAVDKIVGPGNVFVTLAKKFVSGDVGIDMPAGPSEVCVVADENANPKFIASDLIVQVEHSDDCSAYFITASAELADKVECEIIEQVKALPRQESILKALELSVIIITKDLDEAVEWANNVGPEHLTLMVNEPMGWLPKIKTAGAILLGDYSPQSLGDYAAGPSHTLPTGGAGRFASPLNVDDFMKKTSLISYNKEQLKNAAPIVETLANLEGFEGHANAVKVRLD